MQLTQNEVTSLSNFFDSISYIPSNIKEITNKLKEVSTSPEVKKETILTKLKKN